MKILAKPAFIARGGNPVNQILYKELVDLGIFVEEWSPLKQLFSKYDILHIHWPDNVLNNRSALRVLFSIIALYFSLQWIKVRGKKIVWTAHNIKSHETYHPRLEVFFWRMLYSILDGVISPVRFNLDFFPISSNFSVSYIPLGPYPAKYLNKNMDVSGTRGVFIGLIRPYKGVLEVAKIFSKNTCLSGYSYEINGKSLDRDYSSQIRSVSDVSANVIFNDEFVEEESLAEKFKFSSLSILPFHFVTNSGSVILSLSYNTPVLVPSFPMFKELQEDIGKDWVYIYEVGELNEKVILDAFCRASLQKNKVVDWKSYEWKHVAKKTKATYFDLLA